MPATITAAVGRNGANRNADVRVVQALLNGQKQTTNLQTLVVDGLIGPKTITTIDDYQRLVLHFANVDGRVDPGGRTLESLNLGQTPGTAPPPTAPPVLPPTPSTTFMDRVNNFTSHALTTYGIAIAVNSSTRQPLWQQRMHVAHMIKYNSYVNLRPRNFTSIGGHRLISFDHLSSPTLIWGGGLDPAEYLRDATNQPCRKATGMAWQNAPDETKTRSRAYELLSTNGVGTSKERLTDRHSAMVAPGLTGCAEPCLCGGSRFQTPLGRGGRSRFGGHGQSADAACAAHGRRRRPVAGQLRPAPADDLRALAREVDRIRARRRERPPGRRTPGITISEQVSDVRESPSPNPGR